jgi:hypothetical protein
VILDISEVVFPIFANKFFFKIEGVERVKMGSMITPTKSRNEMRNMKCVSARSGECKLSELKQLVDLVKSLLMILGLLCAGDNSQD